MANAGGDGETVPDGRTTGARIMLFFFSLPSLLYSSSYLTLLLFYDDLSVCVTYKI